jgi:hypothetical protein
LAEFNKCLLEAVDEGLRVLGDIAREALYIHLKRECQISREEIPEKLEAFHKALDDIMGAACRAVEKLIALNLYQKLNFNFTEHGGWTLIDYVDEARKTSGSASLGR